MATVNLGRVQPQLRGEYNPATTYEKLDVVSYEGGSYIAKQTTLGKLPTDLNYWQVNAEKGAKGETGATGSTGAKGETGATGPQGEPGKDGTNTWGEIIGNIENQTDLINKINEEIQSAIYDSWEGSY